MSKFIAINSWDGNEQVELEATTYEDAVAELLDYLGWFITEEDDDEEENYE